MFHSVQELDGKNMEMSGDGTEVFMRKEDQLFLGVSDVETWRPRASSRERKVP
jgi:hypothetical protein